MLGAKESVVGVTSPDGEVQVDDVDMVEDEAQVPLDQQEVIHPNLDWSTAPERFREAHERANEMVDRLKRERDKVGARRAEDKQTIAALTAENVCLKVGLDVEGNEFDADFARTYRGPAYIESVRDAYRRKQAAADAAINRRAAAFLNGGNVV
jgi:hypothetical protein